MNLVPKMWDANGMSAEFKEQVLQDYAKKLLVQHVAGPDEIAEAYLFCMKSVFLLKRPRCAFLLTIRR